jgi:SMC interacting uncharacterized protein involved in chromosome segregation
MKTTLLLKSFAALSLAGAFASLMACSHNPHKAEKIDTAMESNDVVSGDTKVGVKGGEMMVQKKVQMNEELRRIQYEVYELEDHVYGNRKYGSLGLYGVLKDCRMSLSDPEVGGDGKLKWTEPMDRITDKDDDLKMGLDDSKKLIGVSEEYLKDRIERFRGYKQVLQKREDEYDDKVSICKAELKAQRRHSEKDAQTADSKQDPK